MSLVGIAVLFGIAFLLSTDRKHINLRTVGLAFALQVTFAALILYVPGGDRVVSAMADGVSYVIDYAYVGIEFLFGDLGKRKPDAFIFAFHVLPVIVFFAALMATLYYLGIMQKVVNIVGGALHRLLQTSRVESMNAAANIFVG